MATSVQVPSQTQPEASIDATLRRLGVGAMLGGPMMLIMMGLDLSGRLPGGNMGRVDGILSLAYVAGWMCSAAAIRRLRLLGDGRVAEAASAVQFFGLAMAAAWACLVIAHPHPDTAGLLFQVTDPSWPLSHIFMLVLGAAVITARKWLGWRRYVPFACGLVLPCAFAAGRLAGRPAMEAEFAIHSAVSWTALGCAVFMSARRRPAWALMADDADRCAAPSRPMPGGGQPALPGC
jgi:hypothetical protein